MGARSRTFDSHPTCPVSAADTQTCRALHVPYMVAPLSSAVVTDVLYFVQFFSTKVELHRAPFCGTHSFCVILPYGAEANCVAPEQYTIRSCRPRKREKIFGLGSGFSSREWHIR